MSLNIVDEKCRLYRRKDDEDTTRIIDLQPEKFLVAKFLFILRRDIDYVEIIIGTIWG